MTLSRCGAFNRDNLRCLLTAQHPGQGHSFGRAAPGPPSPPPRQDQGEWYADRESDVGGDARDAGNHRTAEGGER